MVVGAGPNGLAAAVTLARAGLRVQVVERGDTIGGGARTAELTLPGFRHDICSAVHPMALASGFFRPFGLERRIDLVAARDLVRPSARRWPGRDRLPRPRPHRRRTRSRRRRLALAHGDRSSPTPTGSPNSPGRTCCRLRASRSRRTASACACSSRGCPPGTSASRESGARDAHRCRGPLHPADAEPVHRGRRTERSAAMRTLAAGPFRSAAARRSSTRWRPISLAHGGEIVTGAEASGPSTSCRPPAAVLFDTTPRALAEIAGGRLPDRLLRRSAGSGTATASPRSTSRSRGPSRGRTPSCARAGTVHVGGTRAEIAAAEREVARGRHTARPLRARRAAVDASIRPRARGQARALGVHARAERVRRSIRPRRSPGRSSGSRPGFRDVILASSSMTARDMENYNPNYIGGDIAAGAASFAQLVARPVLSTRPVADAGIRRLPVLVVDPARARRARPRRLVRREERTEAQLRNQEDAVAGSLTWLGSTPGPKRYDAYRPSGARIGRFSPSLCTSALSAWR